MAISTIRLAFEDTKIIRDFEGFSNKAYPDPATGGDPWTISWGLTGPWVVPGLVLSTEDCKLRFMERIEETCKDIDECIPKTLNKNQYISILSLVWNIGIGNFRKSTLLKLLNAGKVKEAADQFLVWTKANKKVLPGLVTRRAAERELFLKV